MMDNTQLDQLAVIMAQQLVGADVYEAPDLSDEDDGEEELKEYGREIARVSYAVAKALIEESRKQR
jgi:hypothetical protein